MARGPLTIASSWWTSRTAHACGEAGPQPEAVTIGETMSDPVALTVFLTKIIGPVLLLRALSIVIDREHFHAMIEGFDREITTVSFSLFPIAMLMGFIALAISHLDWSSPAAVLLHVIAWGGMAKTSALILFPKVMVAKARVVTRAGFLNVVLGACFLVGGYFTWFGYLS
jgi:hypothetical protein